MVVFDATMLMLLIRPDSATPRGADGNPVLHVSERIAHLVEIHERARTRIGIPTPALSEVLVRSGANAVKIVEKIKEYAVFEILPLDELAAIELAIMTKNAIEAGDKRSGSSEVWSKVKFDRQIVAIARVRQASAIFTDDRNLQALARSLVTGANFRAEVSAWGWIEEAIEGWDFGSGQAQTVADIVEI